jgi:hypothetical protein
MVGPLMGSVERAASFSLDVRSREREPTTTTARRCYRRLGAGIAAPASPTGSV